MNKIEQAYEDYCNNTHPADNIVEVEEQGFKAGAEWALNEAVKVLQGRYETYARQGDQDASYHISRCIELISEVKS